MRYHKYSKHVKNGQRNFISDLLDVVRLLRRLLIRYLRYLDVSILGSKLWSYCHYSNGQWTRKNGFWSGLFKGAICQFRRLLASVKDELVCSIGGITVTGESWRTWGDSLLQCHFLHQISYGRTWNRLWVSWNLYYSSVYRSLPFLISIYSSFVFRLSPFLSIHYLRRPDSYIVWKC